MSIQTEIDEMQAAFQQIRALQDIRSKVNGCYSACTGLRDAVLKYQDQGNFDNVPAETKAAFTRLYQIFNQARIDCEADAAFDILVNY